MSNDSHFKALIAALLASGRNLLEEMANLPFAVKFKKKWSNHTLNPLIQVAKEVRMVPVSLINRFFPASAQHLQTGEAVGVSGKDPLMSGTQRVYAAVQSMEPNAQSANITPAQAPAPAAGAVPSAKIAGVRKSSFRGRKASPQKMVSRGP